MSKRNKKTTKLTPEAAKKLRPLLDKLGLEIRIVYEAKCEFCGKRFTSKDEERLDKRFEKHIDEKCTVAKWMYRVFKILEIMGLKNVIMADLIYVQEGRFPEGCERTNSKELDILNRAKDLLK